MLLDLLALLLDFLRGVERDVGGLDGEPVGVAS